jgi:thiamine-phosphate pyrophosphorylase
MTLYDGLIDANISRLGEGLRVLEDVLRFELYNKSLVGDCNHLRTRLKEVCTSMVYAPLVNARNKGEDHRAKSPVPRRASLADVVTANIKRTTQACRVLEETTGDPAFTEMRYDLYALEQAIWPHIQRQALGGPGMYVVSDNPQTIHRMADLDCVRVVQFRDKHQSKAHAYTVCRDLVRDLSKKSVLFIVNDYVDIAMAVAADGVHVGQDDIPTQAIRRILGPVPIIGRTTHSLEQGLVAETEGADYVSCGPIWDTPSKPGRPGIGLSYLKSRHLITIPVVAIGGIDRHTVEQVLPYKPDLIGVIRAVDDVDYMGTILAEASL